MLAQFGEHELGNHCANNVVELLSTNSVIMSADEVYFGKTWLDPHWKFEETLHDSAWISDQLRNRSYNLHHHTSASTCLLFFDDTKLFGSLSFEAIPSEEEVHFYSGLPSDDENMACTVFLCFKTHRRWRMLCFLFFVFCLCVFSSNLFWCPSWKIHNNSLQTLSHTWMNTFHETQCKPCKQSWSDECLSQLQPYPGVAMPHSEMSALCAAENIHETSVFWRQDLRGWKRTDLTTPSEQPLWCLFTSHSSTATSKNGMPYLQILP